MLRCPRACWPAANSRSLPAADHQRIEPVELGISVQNLDFFLLGSIVSMWWPNSYHYRKVEYNGKNQTHLEDLTGVVCRRNNSTGPDGLWKR